VPLTDLATLSPELAGIVQRVMPQGTDQKRPPVSAFNSSI
jgi:FXSXX-COOH protein